jgi:hypothetical protein
MDLDHSVDKADALGTSVNQTDPESNAAEFEKLSRESTGNSRGWKFDREELQRQRRPVFFARPRAICRAHTPAPFSPNKSSSAGHRSGVNA